MDNLLPSCSICNDSKGEEAHAGALIKPDAEDPEPFFWLQPDTGKLEPHPALDDAARRRAEETIRLCNLQRPALCTQRALYLQRVARWLYRLANEPPCILLIEEKNEFFGPRSQYKFVLRHQLALSRQPTLAELDRHKFEAAH